MRLSSAPPSRGRVPNAIRSWWGEAERVVSGGGVEKKNRDVWSIEIGPSDNTFHLDTLGTTLLIVVACGLQVASTAAAAAAVPEPAIRRAARPVTLLFI